MRSYFDINFLGIHGGKEILYFTNKVYAIYPSEMMARRTTRLGATLGVANVLSIIDFFFGILCAGR